MYKGLNIEEGKMLKAIALSGLILLSFSSVAVAEVVPNCRYVPAVTDVVDDPKCSVKIEGSLDKEYKGNRTFVPKTMTIRWSDGATTRVEFKSIFEISGGVVSGAASVDGHIHRFMRSGDGKGFVFDSVDANLNTKKFSVSFANKR
jgi:hypothetical protein